jgi:hypothetical protein
MRKFTALLGAAVLTLTASNAFAADVTVVTFKSNDCNTCSVVENQLNSALAMVGSERVEEVTIDSSDALKWEVSAHSAFDKNVVPQFNKWVGLTGFAAIVDTKTQRTLGCVNAQTDTYKMANFIKQAASLPYDRNVSNRSSEFTCPPTFNVDPG